MYMKFRSGKYSHVREADDTTRSTQNQKLLIYQGFICAVGTYRWTYLFAQPLCTNGNKRATIIDREESSVLSEHF